MRVIWTLGIAAFSSWSGPVSAQADPPQRCPDAITTLDINDCLNQISQAARDRRAAYLAAAAQRHVNKAALTEHIKASDAAFSKYVTTECGAVYESWGEGSIRNAMALSCRIALDDQRTHTIWRNWLTYMDSTPPDLPEPKPTP